VLSEVVSKIFVMIMRTSRSMISKVVTCEIEQQRMITRLSE